MKAIIVFAASILYSTLLIGQSPDCNNISVTTGSGSIIVSGVNAAPIVGVQVFNSSWASVFNQTYTSHGDVITVSPIAPGQYFVNVRFYNSNWSSICEKGTNVSVANSPPPADTCPPTFQKTYGNAANGEKGLDMAKSTDGGYVVAGEAAASGTNGSDALLMKLDSRGNLIWSKTFGGGLSDHFRSVIATTDGGYLAAGSTNNNGFGTYSGEAWIVKTDALGNAVWQKKYTDNSNPGLIYDIVQTSDGGYAFTGDLPYSPGIAECMVVKTDASGNIQWQKRVGTNNSDNGTGILEDNHGSPGLVVSSNFYSGTFYDVNLTKFNLTNGNLLWTKSWDFDSRANWLSTIEKVSDGFIVNGVVSDGFEGNNAEHNTIKTDFDGNLIYAREYSIAGARNGIFTVLNDGGLMIVLNELPTDVDPDFRMIRTNAAGNVLWAKNYPRAGAQDVWGILTDGDFVIGAGSITSGSYNDVMLIKADLSGKMGTCSSVPENATMRNLIVTNLGNPWTTNTNLNLSVVNTTGTGSPAFQTTVLCIDSCGPPPPQVSIGSITVNENDGNAVLQVCLSATSTQSVTVQYATANGSAIAGSDYTSTSSMVTIPAGQTCASISIPILNDASVESTETFTVTLSNPTNATIANGTGTVTINDDDQSQFNCNNVTINPGSNLITIGGLAAPVITIQVFNTSWATVFNQTYTNSPGTVNVPIGPGTYLVKVTFYNSNWTYICDKSQNVTVINQCPAGTICISNICPAQTVDLNTAYSIPNLPAGTTVSWHTGNPATDANKMTAQQAQNVGVSGTYYAAINISGGNCYSQTIPVNVTIVPCTSSPIVNAIELKSDGERATRKIMVFPNPFTSSVRVIIDSEKKEAATLMFTDPLGRLLQRKPILLVPGSNTVMLDGLDKYPSGNYFLQIASPDGLKTFKLIRQQ